MVTMRDVVFLYASLFALYCLWVGWWRDYEAWKGAAVLMTAILYAVYYLG